MENPSPRLGKKKTHFHLNYSPNHLLLTLQIEHTKLHIPRIDKSTVRLEDTDILNFFLRFRELLQIDSAPQQITQFLKGE